MGGRLLAALTVAGLAMAACGQATADGSLSGSASAATPTAANATSPTAATAVQRSCSRQVPAVIASSIPRATATFVPHNALGSNCQWHAADYARRAVAMAITSVPYSGWRGMQPALTDQTTVSGYAAVRGHTGGSCVVLVDVGGAALDVELTGVPDPTCQTTTTLAGQVLAASR